jgi:hypothetical protein
MIEVRVRQDDRIWRLVVEVIARPVFDARCRAVQSAVDQRPANLRRHGEYIHERNAQPNQAGRDRIE